MKTVSAAGLTRRQRESVGHFLDLFTDVEAALKKRLALPADDKTGVKVLINAYETKNPYWRDSANCLRHLTDIRNVLTHQRGTAFGYPVAITSRSIEALREIKAHLARPESVSARYCRKVLTVSASDSLAHVVALSFENGFSQFPVVDAGRFGGLVTESEITRWLGHRVKGNSAEVDLRDACVRTVLKEKDPTMRGIAIFRFRKSDAPVEEVMGMFSMEATLEVALLTESGSKHTPIKGIVTQWDAARFSHPQ
ncbi:MAG: CBS domain-containing protein [Verrucomicrobia subdivision 3 bacterium]|nr:CBS domain-containing protein [Limisphaerales bacterium]